MKFSLFKNDKNTARDELILFLFILACLIVGIALVVVRPEFWIISSSLSMSFGIVWILIAIMFIPGLIYRLMTNDIKK